MSIILYQIYYNSVIFCMFSFNLYNHIHIKYFFEEQNFFLEENFLKVSLHNINCVLSCTFILNSNFPVIFEKKHSKIGIHNYFILGNIFTLKDNEYNIVLKQ